MITLKDIQTAVSKLLTANEYTVIASEVNEGFEKPACFVDAFPVGAVIENQWRELITAGVEISYIPQIETREELINTAEKFKTIFLYTPLEVQDRFLSINEITFDTDKASLKSYFEVEFYNETPSNNTQYPKMENLEERVVVNNHGTSQNTN